MGKVNKGEEKAEDRRVGKMTKKKREEEREGMEG